MFLAMFLTVLTLHGRITEFCHILHETGNTGVEIYVELQMLYLDKTPYTSPEREKINLLLHICMDLNM